MGSELRVWPMWKECKSKQPEFCRSGRMKQSCINCCKSMEVEDGQSQGRFSDYMTPCHWNVPLWRSHTLSTPFRLSMHEPNGFECRCFKTVVRGVTSRCAWCRAAGVSALSWGLRLDLLRTMLISRFSKNVRNDNGIEWRCPLYNYNRHDVISMNSFR